MTRNTARELAVQIVFGAAHSEMDAAAFAADLLTEEHFASLSEESELYAELPKNKYMSYITTVTSCVFDNLTQIDAMIQKYSISREVKRISGTALAVLRVAVCELLYMAEDVPAGVAINSAVEIAKGYDSEETVSFINGVLGSIAREVAAPQPAAADAAAPEEAALS